MVLDFRTSIQGKPNIAHCKRRRRAGLGWLAEGLTLSLTRGPKPDRPLKVTLAPRNIVSSNSSGTGAVQSTEIGLTEVDRQIGVMWTVPWTCPTVTEDRRTQSRSGSRGTGRVSVDHFPTPRWHLSSGTVSEYRALAAGLCKHSP